jgi:subtilisin-like proprotein convertase family protein
MEISQQLEALDALVGQGKFVEAIAQFFDENVVAYSHPGDLIRGKQNKLYATQGFEDSIDHTNQIMLHSQAVGDGVSMSEFTFDFTQHGGNRLIWNEVIRRKWENGKVVEEKYYSCECNCSHEETPAQRLFQHSMPTVAVAPEFHPVEERLVTVESTPSLVPDTEAAVAPEPSAFSHETEAPVLAVATVNEAPAIAEAVENQPFETAVTVATTISEILDVEDIPGERHALPVILTGEKVLVLEENPWQTIPDNSPDGLTSAIEVNTPGYVDEMGVYVDIRHPFIGDLTVKLVSPSGKEITLHERQGSNRDNIIRYYSNQFFKTLRYENLQGHWKLRIWDSAARDKGILQSWRLHLLPGAPDDLKIVEGIGPAIEKILQNAGIWAFRQLAETPAERVREILAAAGPRYKMHDPTTWGEQAELAADGKYQELYAWQEELKAGKVE